jgi:hypothetical protein
MGLITQRQLLAAEQDFEIRRTAIANEALTERLQVWGKSPDRNPAEMEAIHREMEQLEQQHQLRMAQIKGSIKVDDFKGQFEVFKTIEQSLTQMGTTMLTNWRNVGAQLRSVLSTIGTTIIQELILKPAAAKAIAWVKDRAMTIAGIGADAAKAGSGAASSVASVPLIGPILAIAALGTVFAAVAAMSSRVPSHSAAGGFDIPGTMNPIVQAHSKEMILPQKLADWVRGATNEGQGGAGGDTHQWNITTLDARSFRQWLRDGGGDLVVEHLKQARRDFKV